MGGGGTEWRWWLGSDSSHVFLSQSVRKQKSLIFCSATPIVTHNLHVTKAERPVPLFKVRVLLNMLRVWEKGVVWGGGWIK